MTGEIELEYEPDSFVGPLNLQKLKSIEACLVDELPGRFFDLSYINHISKYHGGIPKKQWFMSAKGTLHRVGRFLNFATEETLTPPFQDSWLHSDQDIRLDWSWDYIQGIANISEGCGVFLRPFAILYSGPHHPDEMQVKYADLLCFSFKEEGSPRVVVWYNEQALTEHFRCKAAGLDTTWDVELSNFTEEVATTFDDFLTLLREHREDLDK